MAEVVQQTFVGVGPTAAMRVRRSSWVFLRRERAFSHCGAVGSAGAAKFWASIDSRSGPGRPSILLRVYSRQIQMWLTICQMEWRGPEGEVGCHAACSGVRSATALDHGAIQMPSVQDSSQRRSRVGLSMCGS